MYYYSKKISYQKIRNFLNFEGKKKQIFHFTILRHLFVKISFLFLPDVLFFLSDSYLSLSLSLSLNFLDKKVIFVCCPLACIRKRMQQCEYFCVVYVCVSRSFLCISSFCSVCAAVLRDVMLGYVRLCWVYYPPYPCSLQSMTKGN